MKHILLALWALLAISPVLRGETTEEAYQTIFGQDEKKASASGKAAAEFSAKLLMAVDKVIESKDLKIYVCRKAFEYGMKDKSGLSGAMDAANRLLKLDPERAGEAGEMRLKVRERQYQFTTGPDKRSEAVALALEMTDQARWKLQAQQPTEAVKLCQRASQIVGRGSPYSQPPSTLLRTCTAQENAEKEAARLEGSDASARTQATAKKLLSLYLLDLNSPIRASKVLDLAEADKVTRDNVALAAEDIQKLSKAQCLALAQWYREMKVPKGLGQANALRRSLNYYRQFRKLHNDKDTRDVAAKVAIDQVLADLAAAENWGEGTLYAVCDDEFTLAVNGRVLTAGDGWSDVKECYARLREGDVIAVKVRDNEGERGFAMLLVSASRKPITGSRQRDWVEYEPLSEAAWWVPASDRSKPCSLRTKTACVRFIEEKSGIKKPPCQTIWGTRKLAFIMHVVTAEELGRQK